jgi:uncharacterized cupredoxin-like copper-binding protein
MFRFVPKSSGAFNYEQVLGAPEELGAHSVLMFKMPDMRHAYEIMVSVAFGQAAEVVGRIHNGGCSRACRRNNVRGSTVLPRLEQAL